MEAHKWSLSRVFPHMPLKFISTCERPATSLNKKDTHCEMNQISTTITVRLERETFRGVGYLKYIVKMVKVHLRPKRPIRQESIMEEHRGITTPHWTES